MKNVSHGMILYMTIEEFFTEYVKSNDLERTQIIIVSRDVTADIKNRERYNNIVYSSKYDNIDFVPSLIPTPESMEFAYSDDKTRFIEAYEGHLLSDDVFTDIICIVDMVVNDGINIILLSSRAEFKSQFPYFLKDFIYERFGLKICLSEQLAESETEEEYTKLIQDIGDVEEIKLLLEQSKIDLTDDASSAEEFFNRFMEDAPVKYRRVLMTKDKEALLEFSKEKGLHISRRKTKEEIVDMIVNEVFGDSKL